MNKKKEEEIGIYMGFKDSFVKVGGRKEYLCLIRKMVYEVGEKEGVTYDMLQGCEVDRYCKNKDKEIEKLKEELELQRKENKKLKKIVKECKSKEGLEREVEKRKGKIIGVKSYEELQELRRFKGKFTRVKTLGEVEDKVLELYKKGYSYRQIGKILGISHTSVMRIVKNNLI